MANRELYSKNTIEKAWDAYRVEFREATKSAPVEPKSNQKLYTLSATIGVFIVLAIVSIVVFVTAPKPNPQQQLVTYLILFAMPAILPIVVGGITWFVLGLAFGGRLFNFQSARSAAEKLKLEFVGLVPITNELIKGNLPRLHDNGSVMPTAAVGIRFGGTVDGIELYGIECIQEISLISGLQGANRTLTGVVAKSPRSTALDMILLPKADPQIKYFGKEINGGQKLGDYSLQFDRWGAFASGWESNTSLLQGIEKLIGERKDVCVQILSGVVCVYWHIGEPNLLKKVSAEAYEKDILLAKDIAKLLAAKD